CDQRPHAQVFDLTEATADPDATASITTEPSGAMRVKGTTAAPVIGDVEDVEGDPADRADHDWPIDGDLLVIADRVLRVIAWEHYRDSDQPYWVAHVLEVEDAG